MTKNLFSSDTIPINNVTSKNHVFHIDIILWRTNISFCNDSMDCPFN